MVAATQQQQQQATATVPSAEEEALKRNTDCVYFLASPLTCKKGSECEYRHSEYARVNPRDCYYWLNGNCLNPKCGFRHPPLDGLFGNQAATSAGPSLPPSQKVAPSAVHTPQNSGKQAVPCFYFQKGLCYKGDRCAFSHGPSSTSNKVSQPIVPLAGSELPPQTKAFAGPQKFTPVQKIPQANFAKAVEASADSKPASKPDIGSRRHVVGVERNLPPSKSMDDEVPKFKATNIQPVANGNSSRFNRLHHPQVPDDQNFQNGKDVDEFLRESSPGFDVLVDNELRNSDFYHGEDQYGSATGPEGINLNPVAEYDRGHSADYSSVADIDRETYRDLRGYDTYELMQGQYAWDQHRSSSERMPLGPAHMERRGYSRADSPEHVEDADLRYRLAKHRRVNGLRSVVSHDFVSDSHVEEKGYRSSSRRDSHNISSRLHGRIKLPGSSSDASDLRVERGIDNGRNRGRLSPGRSQISSHQVRLRDRIRARGEENHDSEGRSLRDSRVRRETADDRINFAPPKSLAELKGTKSTEGMPHQSLRKRKQLEDHQPSEGDLSFEGPMPLSEILKRKREAGSAASGSRSSFNKHDNNQKESKEGLLSSSNNAAVADIESGPSFVKDEANRQLLKNEEESKSITAVENTEVDDQREPDTEDGMIVDDGVEEGQEYEADDQREGDYEYEQGDGGEYYEEGENAEGEEEYVEEEDGDADADDFAKKIGVMFT